MARGRWVKPEFWDDEKIGILSDGARLLFLCMLNHADDKGRARGHASYWRAQAWRYRDVTLKRVEGYIEELTNAGVVVQYEHNGELYLVVPRLVLHQSIAAPRPSKLPAPERVVLEQAGLAKELIDELMDNQPWHVAGRFRRGRCKIRLQYGEDNKQKKKRRRKKVVAAKEVDVDNQTGKEGGQEHKVRMNLEKVPKHKSKKEKRKKQKESLAGKVREVFEFWCNYMWTNHRQWDPAETKLNAKRKEKIQARLREGYTVDDLKKAIIGITKSDWHMGNNNRGEVYTELVLIMRDGAQVEKFRRLAERSHKADDIDDEVWRNAE